MRRHRLRDKVATPLVRQYKSFSYEFKGKYYTHIEGKKACKINQSDLKFCQSFRTYWHMALGVKWVSPAMTVFLKHANVTEIYY